MAGWNPLDTFSTGMGVGGGVDMNPKKAFPNGFSGLGDALGGGSKNAGSLGTGQFKADKYDINPDAFTNNDWSENLKGDFRSQLAASQGQQAPMVHANDTDAALANAARLGPAAQAQAAQIDMAQQAQFRNAQMGLAQQLQAQALGQGPSLAQSQLRQGTERNIANQMAMAGTAGRGNLALAQRGAALNAASINQQAAQQAADIRAQEQMSAQGQLANVAGQARGADIGLATNQAGLTQQTSLANQSALNSFAQQQAAMQQQVELANASAKNQAALANQGAMLAQRNQANQMAQFYNSGIAQQNLQQQQGRMSLEQLQANNQNAIQGINEKAYAAASAARGNLMGGLGGGLMAGAAGGLFSGLFGGGDSEGLMSESDVVDTLAQGGEFGLAGKGYSQGSFDVGCYSDGSPNVGDNSSSFVQALNANSKSMADEAMRADDKPDYNAAATSGGLVNTMMKFKNDGGVVDGKAEVDGDSPKNDTVPALLSPGEAVIPRTAMNNPEKMDKFVDALKEYKGFKAEDGVPQEYMGHSLVHLHNRMSDLEKAFKSKARRA